jgi:hypothetical protein
MYCGNWFLKSCECLRQCYRHICPNGPRSCERPYELASSKCFERHEKFAEKLDGVEWDGGSLLPDEAEAGVNYSLGVPNKIDGKSFGVVQEIDR